MYKPLTDAEAVMSTISTLSSLFTSPRERLQDRLDDAIKDGSVKKTDKSALAEALDSLDKSIEAAKANSSPMSPADLKKRIDSLIDEKVKSGALSADQAKELRGVLDRQDGRGAAALKALDSAFAALNDDGTIRPGDKADVKAGLDKLRNVFEALGPSSDPTDQAFLAAQATATLSALVSAGEINQRQAGGVLKTPAKAQKDLGDTGTGPDQLALSRLKASDLAPGTTLPSQLKSKSKASGDAELAAIISQLIKDIQSQGFDYAKLGSSGSSSDSWPLLLDFKI